MIKDVKQKSIWIWSVAAVTLVVDYLTKVWTLNSLGIAERLEEFRVVVVIPGCLQFVGRINHGGAFSIMSGHTLLLTGLSLIALGFLIWWVYSLREQHRVLWLAFGLIIGGALGNLGDRLFREGGGVVDFIDAYIGAHHWPTFNIADSGICVGLGLVIYLTLVLQPETPPEEKPGGKANGKEKGKRKKEKPNPRAKKKPTEQKESS